MKEKWSGAGEAHTSPLGFTAPDLLPTSWHWIPSFGADILLSSIIALFPWWILELHTLQARFPCLNNVSFPCQVSPAWRVRVRWDKASFPSSLSQQISFSPFSFLLFLHVGLNLIWHRVVWHMTESMWKLQPPKHSSGCSRNKYFSLSHPGIMWDPALLLYIIKLTNVNQKLPVSTKLPGATPFHSRSRKAY